MDPSADGFNIPSPAFTTSAEGSGRANGSLKRNATQVSRLPIPGTFIDIPSDASATSDAHDSDSRTTTPPRQLSRHNSDFPPTPPTMTNSAVAESVPAERRLSPSPAFADRVRQELQRHKSGLSTPVNLSNSPPTPDPSPPSKRDPDQIHLQRPSLLQQNYASSYAESFQTATEGRRTPHMSSTEVEALLPSEIDATPRQSWIEMGRAMGLSNKVLDLQEEERVHTTDSDSDIVSRVKNYHLESDGSDREKDQKTELKLMVPSDIPRSATENIDSTHGIQEPGRSTEDQEEALTYSASDERSTSDDNAPVSPTLYRSISQKQAVAVPRLARPFQPGDDIKRPDSFLLYGSAGSVKKWKKPERMSKTPPAREMDSEFLRNAEPVFQSAAPEVPRSEQDILEKRHSAAESGKDILQRLEDVIKEDQPEPTPLTALPPIPPEERQIITPAEEEVKPLKEFAPAPAPATKDTPSPPSTAQKEKSLEDNNVVYKMIQEENAKRHSAISDGSVQARVVVPAEKKPVLRHTLKRDSLRGDISLISSSDSVHKLRHKRRIGSLGNSEASPESARHSSHDVANIRPSMSGTEAKTTPSRTGEKCFSYSAIRDSSPRVAPASALGNPHKLRRSLRHHSLDQTPRSVSDSARPLSMATSGFAALAEEPAPSSPRLRRSSAEHQLDCNNDVRRNSLGHASTEVVPASPRLRKTSAEHRLDRNNEVQRTSLGHTPEPKAAPAERSPQLVAEELLQINPKEEVEQSPRLPTSERVSRRDRRESSEVSFKTAHSPRRKSVDYRSLHPTITPMSQMSGTAASEAELCEATGVPFFPHNNKSLLVVQTARQVHIPDYTPIDEDDSDLEGNPIPGIKRTNFKAFVTPADEIGKPLYSVESPLTNPREAPEPPVIKFIPPTPIDELQRQLGVAEDQQRPRTTETQRGHLQRSLSLKDRIRRFSESLNQPVPFGRQNSNRRSAPSRRTPQAEAQRPTHLSSFWQPRDFWADYYSDSDVEEDDDEEGYAPLPAGGDTSEVTDEERRKRNAFSFPRAMSKRMPGFRGTGGFLMGNSLGIDRHGSNSRRHHVDRRVNASHPSLRQYSSSTPNVGHRQSEEMLRRLSNRRIFKVPFSGGRRVEYVGLSAFGARLRAKRDLRRERQAEDRRAKLRESIGTRLYHDGPRGAGRGN